MVDFLIELLLVAPTVLIALTFHECAHGFIAYKLGDPTAKYLGRLTLNPIRHIDPIGAICMLIAHFGWAKPVPIDVRNFKKPKRDLALSALAGPCANLLLALVGCFLLTLTKSLLPPFYEKDFAYWLAYAWMQFIYYFGWLNISLALFNLIPIPPLDGSKILSAFLPPKAYNGYMRYEREIGLVFMVILIADSRFLGGYITGALSFLVNGVFNAFISLFELIF